MNDITNRKDIELMVDTFYGSVREDDLLGPVFNRVIKNNWPKHLDTMYRFWQTVLLHEFAYKGSPFVPHRKLPVEAHHFERWIYHFNSSMDENLAGKIAEEAKLRAHKMAEMFMYKLNINSNKKRNT
ncbi:group III truncated hemoglobin [Psychroflexus gondwanensis]|uniref:group III truncated hemoglobin n=1 Tax=Psychroflexus gondwanensis TaxID=251 RepID=UPI0011BF0339|nr:group III truncated hemoglobin [Psychroflexus gondwanensis]TXE20553.1 group III truncated hemoglobin [Psychroflexus gondwanensis]